MVSTAKLIIKNGPQAKNEILLTENKDEFILGRANEGNSEKYITLNQISVSRRHAKLCRKNNGRSADSFELIDLKSTNGTYLYQFGKWRRLRPYTPTPLFNQYQFRLGVGSSGIKLKIVGILEGATMVESRESSESSVYNVFFESSDELRDK